MAFTDSCEPEMIRALEKAGWTVVEYSYPILINQPDRSYVYADLRLIQLGSTRPIIVVEVKCFPPSSTQLEEFYHAVGQYMVYRTALESQGIEALIYLAVPTHVEYFLSKSGIQATVKSAKIRVVMIDLITEEVVEWMD